ncbi:hypothetical protein ACHRV1_25980 [Flavobacterium aquidurense]|uniref:hypothetical protein n=1 Tax=Flavobacterium TaxID=237 RepID=UPI00375833E5
MSLAANWLHEWLHVSGFRHAGNNPDDSDVNYMVGTFVVETGREPLEIFGKEFARQQGQDI